MSDDPILDQIRALLEAARREAYERGQADAVRRIMAAASATPGPGVIERPAAAAPRPAPFGGGTAATADQEGHRRTRARRGTVDARVLEVLGNAPEGATIAEIEAASGDDAEPLKTPSIRVALQRLLGGGRVLREGRRWRLAAPGAREDEGWSEATADEEEDGDAAVGNDDAPGPAETSPRQDGGYRPHGVPSGDGDDL